ncbi:MAG: MATE family efflux transporter [Deltaproteobacteria bacterium]|nr:MATE family efflux transporter [Deltaproteobacteria bacterium]
MSIYEVREVRQHMKESWAIGWPMMLVMFFQFSIGIADVYVAGLLGSDVLASVGYVGQLYWTLMIFANAISVGTVAMVSQAYGARSGTGIGHISSNSMTMGIVVSGLITAISWRYAHEIIDLSGMPDSIRGIAENFIKIFSLVLMPTYLMIISSGILRASGRVKMAMVFSCAASLVNVVGDFVLVFGWGPIPSFGYQGIAWSTAFATTLGMCLNLSAIFTGPYRITVGSMGRPSGKCLRNLVRLGVPTALQQTAWNAGTLVVYFLITRLEGSQVTALAAITAGVRVEAIIFLPIFAFNMAAAVVTGNRLGARDFSGARAGAKVTAFLCVSIIVVPTAAVFIFAPGISSFLTTDPAVLGEMTRYLRINMLAEPFFAFGISLAGALQGAGDTLGTMRIIFASMWLFRIPSIIFAIYALKISPTGIWWCMAISVVIMCVLIVYRFRGDKWMHASMDKSKKTMLWEACLPLQAKLPTVTNPNDKSSGT